MAPSLRTGTFDMRLSMRSAPWSPSPEKRPSLSDATSARPTAHVAEIHRLTTHPQYAHALAALPRYASADWLPVLIEGESGTGKTWFAQALHSESPRRAAPFVAYNLAAADSALASAALFGHVPGAFTGASKIHRGVFERAHSGTLFVDELGHASRDIQGKLLHAVERGEVLPLGAERTLRVNTRLVAAIHQPATGLMAAGALLPDLWHRLGALVIRLPSLRQRRSDIVPLVHAIAARDAIRCTGTVAPPTFAADVLGRMEEAFWPGNVRQLEGIVRRLLLNAVDASRIGIQTWNAVVDPAELEPSADPYSRVHAQPPSPGQSPAMPTRSRRVTTAEVVEMVGRSRSPADAARRLGIDRATVGRHLAAARRAEESGPSA